MKINHNIQALNAYRNLYQNQMTTSKNLEKLSSGLRINRAADDAAGLAISEKMRSQITGLKQAERNSLDGISLMQTAEGAMTEVHSMLQRMRELSVQAANDTNTVSDRNAIQLEIDQLNLEIDSIAAKTEFNTRKLLDGSSAADTQYIVGQMEKTYIKDIPKVIDASLQTGRYKVGVESTPELTRKLNQPGAGVSSADVIKIEPFAETRTNEANLADIKVTNPELLTEDATYDILISNKENTYTLTSATGGFLNKSVSENGAGITAGTVLGYGNGLTAGEYTINVTAYDDTTSPKKATLELINPDGLRVGTLLTDVDPDSVLTIGAGSQTVSIPAGIIDEIGEAKIMVQPKPVASEFSIGEDLPPGQYTINVTNFNQGLNTATIQVLGPDNQPVHPAQNDVNLSSLPITFGSGDNQILINTANISGNGTATLSVETHADVTVNKIDANGNLTTAASPLSYTFTNESVHTVSIGGFDLDMVATDIEVGVSTFEVKTSDLGLGEYTIVVSDYQVDSAGKKSATIEVFDPNGFSIGELASEIGADGEVQTIGNEHGKQVKINTALITQAGTAKVQIENKLMISVAKVEVNESGQSTAVSTPITFQKEITTTNGMLQHGGLELTFGANARKGFSEFDLTNKALSFQIGANADQSVFIDIPELSTVKLGVNGLKVTDQESANNAIFRIDQAITKISAIRSKLGATQNRLEHTINNLQTTAENLTSAESRIRDTDMALEMTEFTKNNILNQSAQAMLSQANQLPQGILQLLQR